MTGWNATGGNDVFNGKNRVFGYLVSQDLLAGGHGSSLIRWAWCVNFTVGDQCHRIENGSVAVQGVEVYHNSLVHVFSSGHNHPGDYPAVDAFAQGGFGSGTYTVFHDASGNASVTIVGTHTGSSGAASVATILTATLPQIPQTVASPSAATATRVSDTQQTINWTNNSTGTAPYANLKVYRSTDGGGYALIATLGVVTTYSDTGTVANHKYTYRVSAVGANGVEVGYATTSAVWTTPGAPSGLVATKLAGGNIRLDWTNGVNYSEYGIRIEESQNGGAFSELTSVAGGVATYEHVSPTPSVTHTYRVRSRSTTGSLNSAYSANSNTIVLLATANPPTVLAPSGAARDAAGDIVFTWQHNPADGTPQNQYRLQYKVDAGSYTTVGPTTSAVSAYTLPAGTVANGHTITWHVATSGENGTISSYSADSSFSTSATPTVTISTPGATHNLSSLTAQWTYFQAQSSPQAQWVANLYDATATLLEQISGTTESEGLFAAALADAATYTVTVAVTSAAGLTSALDTQEFTVSYLPPAAVAVAAAFDADAGSTVLTVTADNPDEGVTVAVATVDVQRSIDAGPWVTVAAGLVLALVDDVFTVIVLDLGPTVAGLNTYRVVAYSALPSSAMSAEVPVTTASSWAFLSGGAGFQEIVRMRWDGQYDQATERAAASHHFAGRELPVTLEGDALSGSIGVSVVMAADSSTEAQVHAFARLPGVKLWRDPFGRRMFARLAGLRTSRRNTRTYNLAFTLTEQDYTE